METSHHRSTYRLKLFLNRLFCSNSSYCFLGQRPLPWRPTQIRPRFPSRSLFSDFLPISSFCFCAVSKSSISSIIITFSNGTMRLLTTPSAGFVAVMYTSRSASSKSMEMESDARKDSRRQHSVSVNISKIESLLIPS